MLLLSSRFHERRVVYTCSLGSLKPPKPPYAGHDKQACLMIASSNGPLPHISFWGWGAYEVALWICPTLGAVVGLRADSWACEAERILLSGRLTLRQFRRRCPGVGRKNFLADAAMNWPLASSLVILEPKQNEYLWSEKESWHC